MEFIIHSIVHFEQHCVPYMAFRLSSHHNPGDSLMSFQGQTGGYYPTGFGHGFALQAATGVLKQERNTMA